MYKTLLMVALISRRIYLKLGVDSGLHGLEPGDVRHASPLPRHQLIAGVLFQRHTANQHRQRRSQKIVTRMRKHDTTYCCAWLNKKRNTDRQVNFVKFGLKKYRNVTYQVSATVGRSPEAFGPIVTRELLPQVVVYST